MRTLLCLMICCFLTLGSASATIHFIDDSPPRVQKSTKDGDEVGRTFLEMISDGNFSEEEQSLLEPKLSGFYAVRICWASVPARPRPFYGGDLREPTIQALKELAEKVSRGLLPKIKQVTLWPDPVTAQGMNDARLALKRVRDRLVPLRQRFAEMAWFKGDAISMSDNVLWYSPHVPGRDGNAAGPLIVVCMDMLFPCASAMPSPKVWFPKQRLQVLCDVRMKSSKLNEAIKRIIDSEIATLAAQEKSLGGEPIYDGW